MHSDLLVVGGAVGASWGGPAGWAAFVHATATGETTKLVASVENMTLQDADILPFLAALAWFDQHHHLAGTTPRVVCCSDSRDLVRAGNLSAERKPRYWREIANFEAKGYLIYWLWDGRNNNPDVFAEAERARQDLLAHTG